MNILRLHPDGGGPPITIEHAIVRVGRDASSDVHLRDASVSRHHAEIERRNDDWVIVDQNSGNGIRIDGQRTQQAVLLPGQLLHIGNLRFRIEIDRGDDGATMMLGRSPLIGDQTDQTLLAGPAISREPEPGPEAPPPSRAWAWGVLIGVVMVAGVALAAVVYFSDQRLKEATVPAPVQVIVPTPLSTPEPSPTPAPTPAPTRRPTGSLLISSDIDSVVSIDGKVVGEFKASTMRAVEVAPGEHLVRFRSDGASLDVVSRVRVNEQTVVRRVDGAPSVTPTPTALPTLTLLPMPSPSPTPTNQ